MTCSICGTRFLPIEGHDAFSGYCNDCESQRREYMRELYAAVDKKKTEEVPEELRFKPSWLERHPPNVEAANAPLEVPCPSCSQTMRCLSDRYTCVCDDCDLAIDGTSPELKIIPKDTSTQTISQGKPRTEAQAARYKAKQSATGRMPGVDMFGNPGTSNGSVRARQEVKAEFMSLFPGCPEHIADKMSTEQMEKQIRKDHEKRDRGEREPSHDGKVKKAPWADGEAKRKPAGDRFKSLRLFWKCGVPEGKLTASEKLAWLRIWEVEGAEGPGYASISYAELERGVGSHSSVERALAGLKAKLMLKMVQKGNMEGTVNHYVLAPYPSQKMLDDKDADYGRARRPMVGLPPRPMVNDSGAHGGPLPDWKEEGLPSSSFQTRRSGPDDSRLGDARPSGPTPGETNPDGGTNPLSPPSTPMDAGTVDGEAEFRQDVDRRLEEYTAAAHGLVAVAITRVMAELGKDDLHKRWIGEQFNKRIKRVAQ